ncbi:hypothetical protein FA13DRAFT_1743734 [Coprinellus micaceus]|uniref:Integral membrane protein n=1 Tax=Coprinellus micaceus TaxID=71717 RepID=A0A4Y7SDY1_COPMI|nr:hypothetical protein FA13DRAFT_1743734 [Coprinellus micaceus]
MASLLWNLVLLNSTLASPVLAPPDAVCASYLESYLTTRETTCPATDTAPVFNARYRSTIEIVWSCLTIIFASTWICVHPNVAGYSTTMWQRLWKRLKLFALAIFAPEFLAVFAFYQWKGCRELYQNEGFKNQFELLKPPSAVHWGEEDNGVDPEKQGLTGRAPTSKSSWLARVFARVHAFGAAKDGVWTLTHAHFVQMGGIAFKNPDNHDEIGFYQPESWTDEHIKSFIALRLSEATISDRSKASALAKTLVVMQVLWFVVQTVARALEGLTITHLEVVCLAFTLFNIGMYVCWWDKPLDVECPLEVEGWPGGDHPPEMDWFWTLMGGLDNLPVGQWTYSPKTRLYPSLYCYHASHNRDSFLDKYFSDNSGGALGGAFTLALAFTSATFGALHAIGWSLPSPSHAEHMLWRISCLVLMCYPPVPLVILPFGVLLNDHAPDWVTYVYLISTVFISFCGAVAYVGARFILLVLPFLELRNLPPLAHKAVSWSNFLPHI